MLAPVSNKYVFRIMFNRCPVQSGMCLLCLVNRPRWAGGEKVDTLKTAQRIVKICDSKTGNERIWEISTILDKLKEERETFGAYENLCNIKKIIDSKIKLIEGD